MPVSLRIYQRTEEESIPFSEEASSSLSESVSEFQSVASESEESSISLSESSSEFSIRNPICEHLEL